MKLLLIGGPRFLGRAITDAALERGHELTFFNRGTTNPELYPDVERLVGDAGIVRHRGKIKAVIDNARATLALDVPLGELLWSFVGGEPQVNEWRTLGEIPAQTPESAAMSKELKRRGFRFTGPTSCYALMQAAGLVDDHTLDCFRRG